MAEAPDIKTLGRYNIERVLGKGAMGVVYEGIDPKLNRRVAIKTILKSHLDPDTAKDYSMRFSREAQAVARLNHPHIVQVYDFAEEGDIAYLVMEFIRGKELKNFFDANERFDIKEAVRIMSELLDALDFAHNSHIIHRDIKPANVMLDAQGRTKLTDFGVARVQDTDRTQAERTQAGTMVGTPAYMSPEQITGGNVDKRTDVFSAGIILYQFLTGEKPFTGGGAWTIAKKIIQEDPPLPSTLNNAVTPLFDAVVNKALSKAPETRYQSAKEFGIALKRALEGRGEDEDPDKTIVGDLAAPAQRSAPQPRPAAAAAGTGTSSGTQAGNQEVELEFWRAIKDGTDADDFELYIQQFPSGIYTALAKRKIAKLRGTADETSAEAKKQERKEAEEAAAREAEVRSKLAEEKAKLEAELARKEEEFRKREAEREAQEKARLEAIEKAKQEAAAERERARQEAEQARQEAEKAKQEAAEKAKKELEAERERAKKDAEALAKKQAEERAKREAEFKKREAELRAAKKTHPAVLVGIAAAAIAIAGAGYYFFAPDDAEQKARIAAAQQAAEKARKEAEDARLALEKNRREQEEARKRGDLEAQKRLAEEQKMREEQAKKTAEAQKLKEAERAEAAKLAQEKSKEERARQEKLAAEKAAADRAAAEKIAAERAAQEKAAAEARAAAERAKAEAEKQIAEARAAAERAKAEAERAREAAAKASTTVAAAPSSGDTLFAQAAALEQQGKGNEAVRAYRNAVRAGSGEAAKRLGDIYNKGIAGVAPDYAESLKWYTTARAMGVDVQLQKAR
jgi:serine/threonine-protein kinase